MGENHQCRDLKDKATEKLKYFCLNISKIKCSTTGHRLSKSAVTKEFIEVPYYSPLGCHVQIRLWVGDKRLICKVNDGLLHSVHKLSVSTTNEMLPAANDHVALDHQPFVTFFITHANTLETH